MIFSAEKWDDANELRSYMAVSNALSFKNISASLQNAFELFILPLVGQKIVDKLNEIYNSTTDITEIKADTDDKDLKLLYLAQRANAFLAYWYDYDELQVLIGDSGVKRQESDNAKTPYKYQDQSLKSGFKNKGFDALDNLLQYLEDNLDKYPDYKDSTNYTYTKSSIIRNTSEVDGYYSINNSRIVFLRLKAHFRVVEDTIIAPRLRPAIYDELKEALEAETTDKKFLKLRELLVPVVTFYSIQKLLQETGSVTDRGLFFSTLKGSDDSYESSDLAPHSRVVPQANQAESNAILYWQSVDRYLKKVFEFDSAAGKKIPTRDNNNKKSFWA